MASTFLAAAEAPRDLPIDPILVGILVFALLLAMVAAVLMFGKGRPHS
ncbi:MAG: hypothetical protein H0U28_01880 [Nocardioidaceae bacterium]|nr:hypothetical protein [Nocardioidaceae bacterium]